MLPILCQPVAKSVSRVSHLWFYHDGAELVTRVWTVESPDIDQDVTNPQRNMSGIVLEFILWALVGRMMR